MTNLAAHDKGTTETARSRVLGAASGFFAAADGAPLWFEDSGGEGPALFFIYGLACSIQHWKYPKQYFSSPAVSTIPRRTIYLDFRGHGRSPASRQNNPVTLEQLVADIEALCAYRNIEGATFLGQSLGGTIALKLAAKRPDLAQGLVLLASPGRNPGPYFAFQPFSQLFWKYLIGINRLSPIALRIIHSATVEALRSPLVWVPFREMIRRMGFNPSLAKTKDIEDYIQSVFAVNPNIFFDLAADLAQFDFSALESDITCPTLIISGGQDLVIPISEQRWLAERVPQAEMAVLDYGSHCPHFDDPSQVIKTMERFLNRHEL